MLFFQNNFCLVLYHEFLGYVSTAGDGHANSNNTEMEGTTSALARIDAFIVTASAYVSPENIIKIEGCWQKF